MDIKKRLIECIYTYESRNIGVALEKLAFIMIQDYLKKDGKECIRQGLFCNGRSYDFALPNGIDDIQGIVAVDVKVFRRKIIHESFITNSVVHSFIEGTNFDVFMYLFFNEVSSDCKLKVKEKLSYLEKEIVIWDINDFVRICQSNEKLFEESLNELSNLFVREAVSIGVERTKKESNINRDNHISNLRKAYSNDNVVLFLGAGASKDAKIATWDKLISELYLALMDKKLKEKNITLDGKDKEIILKGLKNQNGSSPLLQTRFLRKGFQFDFETFVKEILYKEAVESSELLEELGQLCIPNRGKLGIKAIVNYNFDDLVEKVLTRCRIKYHSIYSEGVVADADELGIYHVHGFLPEKKGEYDNLAKSLLVFSEEGYHKLSLDPYNWANICQLNFLMNNTCLFVGLSMTDPNLRRLLEIAAAKRQSDNGKCRHYAIMRRLKLSEVEINPSIDRFKMVNDVLQEHFFSELDLNIIWVDEFNEIPELLKKIKG